MTQTCLMTLRVDNKLIAVLRSGPSESACPRVELWPGLIIPPPLIQRGFVIKRVRQSKVVAGGGCEIYMLQSELVVS